MIVSTEIVIDFVVSAAVLATNIAVMPAPRAASLQLHKLPTYTIDTLTTLLTTSSFVAAAATITKQWQWW